MSGLEIAAGAASLVGVCNLVASKLVPLLRDSTYIDETVKQFHHEICTFKEVLVKVEDKFGARSDLRLRRPFNRSKCRAIQRHIEECTRTIGEIAKELPDLPTGESNLSQQMWTHLRISLGSNVTSKLRHDIPALKATLQLWLQVVQLDEIHSSREAHEHGQQVIEAGISDLNQKMDGLKEILQKRDYRLERSTLRSVGEDTVKRGGKECLDCAGSIREACTASYRPTTASNAARRLSPTNIPEWNMDVRRRTTADPLGSNDLDTVTSSLTNESLSLSRADSGYDSDRISRWHSVPDRREGFSSDILGQLVAKYSGEALRYCEAEKYDEAAKAQEEAIRRGRERLRNYQIGFDGERDMLHALAMIQLRRRRYRTAEDILLDLRESLEEDKPQEWVLDQELAGVYLAHGKYESAARYAHRANNGRQAAFEMGDDRIIETLELLSEIYDKMGKRTEATVFWLEALKHLIRQQGPLDEQMLLNLQTEPTEEGVHQIIEKIEDCKARDILALKGFQWAVALNQQVIVSSLWSRYAIVRNNVDAQNDWGMTPLICSVAKEHENMALLLLETGADVNARASEASSNDTALMLAAEKQSEILVQQLLVRGAEVKACNKHGRNALHRAQGRPLDNEDAARKRIVEMFLEQDCALLINTQCDAGKTSLHLASESGNTPIMDFLLSRGADIEARDVGERTALILAVDSGWPRAVQLLLDRGADVEVEDLLGRTPHRIAKKGSISGAREIQALLNEARKSCRMRRQASATTKTSGLPRHSNSSSASISGNTLRRSTTAILSPTAALPPAFPSNHSNGHGELTLRDLRLPLLAPSITSTTLSSTPKRRTWSIYSKIDKVGKELR